MESFKTIYKGDFLWPYLVPFQIKPKQPPETPANNIESEEVLTKPLCRCDRHSWSPHYKRAQYLLEKEKAFREAMISVAQERTMLENEILEHPCTDSDDVVASLYQLNFAKSAFPITDYRAMKADHDDPVVTPVAMLKNSVESGYRDPTCFPKLAIKQAHIHGSPTIVSTKESPIQSDVLVAEKSTYQDTISKCGYMNQLAIQRYREPTVTSRRRGCCDD